MSEFFSDSSTTNGEKKRPPSDVGIFSRLPEELHIAILRCLDAPSISICNQTCRGLRRAIANSMLLQYELALFYCGMRDGPRKDPDHKAQLGRLLTHDAAWRQLAWTNVMSLEHLAGAFHPAAISGSTVAFIPFGPGPVSGFKLLIQQFPSALRGTEIRHWELQFQLMSVHDTLMDSSQDLLILLECDPLSGYTTNYHIYSLTTGRPHPLAANQGNLEVPDGRTISISASGVCGDYIGATAYNPSDKSTHLVLRNWKTGAVKVDAPLPTPPLGIRPTFSFLDRHHILVGFLWASESQPKDLLVCAIDEQHLSNFNTENGTTIAESVPTYIFSIPKTLKRRDFWEIHTHRNSIPLRPENPPLEGYFDNDPEDQLVVIEMASRKYGHSEKLDPAMSLCIPTRAMLRRITATKAMTSSHNKTNHHHHHHHLLHLHHHHHHHHLLLPNHNHQHSIPPPFVFSWESWGEGRALLSKRLDRERRLPMLSRACGLRHVARKPIVYENGKAAAVFRVWDFHPGRAARTITNTTATAAIATTSTCSGGISHHHHHHHNGNGNGNGNGSAIATATATAVAVAAVDGGNLIGHEEAILPAHVVIEVPLPKELQTVDPVLISTSLCQDALIIFERLSTNSGGLRSIFVCSF